MYFGGSNTKGMSTRAKTDYLTDPSTLLAQELMKSGGSTAPVQSGIEGLARALTGVVGGYQSKMMKDKFSQEDTDANSALAAALANPNVQSGIPAFTNPDTGKQAIPAVPGGYDAVTANLKSAPGYNDNSYMQDTATQLAGKNFDNKMKTEEELNKERLLYTDPQILAGKMKLAQAGRSVTNVNMTQEKEEDKAVGKGFGEDYLALQKAGREAPGKIAKYDRLNSLLEGVNTGTFKGTTNEIKAAAKGAGINLEEMGVKDDVAPIQAAKALTNAMALELRNPSGGAGMPGALSDADRNYLTSMVPGIEQTPEGRALMTDTAKKLAQRDAEIAQLSRNYRSKNGKLDEGFYDTLAQYSEANPLFKKPTLPAPKAPGGQKVVKFLGYE